MGKLCALLLFSAFAAAAPTYESAKLLEIHPYADKSIVGGESSVVTVEHDMYEITVQLNDLALTGLYEKKWKWSFDPGVFVVGDPIQVRLDGNMLFIRRAGEKDLKTRIIRRQRTTKVSVEQPSQSK